MIKLTFCLRRLPHLSREEFQRYWRDALNGAMQGSRGGPEAYDGVAELWFESEEAMAANTSKAAANAGAELLEDEKKFIDLANSPLCFGREYEIVG